MAAPTYTLPTLGSDNSVADPLIRTALSDLKTLLTANLDSGNVASGGISFANLSSSAASAGSYSPTITNGTNVAASTTGVCLYTRVGSHVIVHGAVNIDPTAGAGTASVFALSLPISSNLGVGTDLSGLAYGSVSTAEVWYVSGDTGNDRASVNGNAQTTAAHDVYFTFQYVIA